MANEHTDTKSIAFVSDWQSRSSKKQAQFNLILVTALAIAFVTAAIFFFWSKNENHKLIVDYNMKYLQICGIQEADRVEASLEDGVMLISNLSRRYASMMSLLPDTSITEKLELLADIELFDRIGYVSAEGIDTTLEGVADVSDRDYFQLGMAGETGYDFLDASRVTGKPCVVFYAPIRENEQITGIMIGFYEAPRLNEMFSMEIYSYSPNVYLLRSDGSVVANSNHDTSNSNMLEAISQYQFHGETKHSDLLEAIADKSRASVMFEYLGEDGEPTVGVITQLQNCDWIILSILPGSVSSAMIDHTNFIGRVLMFGVSSVFLLLVLGMFVLISRQGSRAKAEMLDTKLRLKEAMEREQQQSFIVDTLATTYSSVYLIDIQTRTYERIEERQTSTLGIIAPKGKWEDAVSVYVEKHVAEPYQETVAAFLDADRFDQYIGNRDSVSVEFMRTDGGWRKMFLLPTRRDETGALLSVIFAVQRIDEEKQKELLAQKALQEAFTAAKFANNAKTAFLSNMSHDIRTPMNAIIGMTMIASNNLENRDRVSDCLHKITASCKHLLGLINEILDMSKIESGRVDLNEESFDLAELIQDLVDMNRVLIEEKNHTLCVYIGDLMHTKVIGDKTRLQQVFTNLLTNAIKYTPAGGALEITAWEDTSSTSGVGKYQVTFRDNGIGMSEEYMKTLFEPFTRARDNRLIGIQGTGLGMPIARNIIRMMNGDIQVKSELNKGSCFTVSFLLKLQPEALCSDDRDSGEAENVLDADFGGKRVLLVEDNELNMEIATEILSMVKLEVDTAGNGKEAVDIFLAAEPDRYDLILMDIQMPVMNGYEATKAIRSAAHPNAKTIPIVAMTANAFSSDVRAARDAGMDGHIAKPIDLDTAIKVLKAVLK